MSIGLLIGMHEIAAVAKQGVVSVWGRREKGIKFPE
jgi:hypothetical protein